MVFEIVPYVKKWPLTEEVGRWMADTATIASAILVPVLSSPVAIVVVIVSRRAVAHRVAIVVIVIVIVAHRAVAIIVARRAVAIVIVVGRHRCRPSP